MSFQSLLDEYGIFAKIFLYVLLGFMILKLLSGVMFLAGTGIRHLIKFLIEFEVKDLIKAKLTMGSVNLLGVIMGGAFGILVLGEELFSHLIDALAASLSKEHLADLQESKSGIVLIVLVFLFLFGSLLAVYKDAKGHAPPKSPAPDAE